MQSIYRYATVGTPSQLPVLAICLIYLVHYGKTEAKMYITKHNGSRLEHSGQAAS